MIIIQKLIFKMTLIRKKFGYQIFVGFNKSINKKDKKFYFFSNFLYFIL